MECEGITCPECGCSIYLEWKSGEEIKEALSSKHSKENVK